MIYKQHKSNIKPNPNKLTEKKKLNKCWFKAKEVRIPFRVSVGKNASTTFLLCYNFSSTVPKLQRPLLIFFMATKL